MNIHPLQPVSGKHSIKEAVISIFLATPIIRPERFQELITGKFKDKFQLFESIDQIRFQLENNTITDSTQLKNRGFKFIGFRNGKTADIIQGINEDNRSFFSFHTLDYTNWSDFKNDFIENLSILSHFHPGLFVTAYSLHYIDEFHYDNVQDYDPKEIFHEKASYLPQAFFSSKMIEFSINTQKASTGNREYFDGLQIKVQNQIPKIVINISHNFTYTLPEASLLGEQPDMNLQQDLDDAHNYNKQLLKDILTEEVSKRIGLHE